MEEPNYFDEFDSDYRNLLHLEMNLYCFLRNMESKGIFGNDKVLPVSRQFLENVFELQTKMDNADPIIEIKDSKYFNEQFRAIKLRCVSILSNCKMSSAIISSLKEKETVDEAKVADLVEHLKNLNKTLEEILNLPEWKEILDIEVKSFQTSLPDLSTQKGQNYSNFLNIARNFDRNDATYKAILETLEEIHSDVFVTNGDAIIGPSLMGKTQSAFNLAVDRPVFYINFDFCGGRQSIASFFGPLSDHVRAITNSDEDVLIKLSMDMAKKEPEDDATCFYSILRSRYETKDSYAVYDCEFLKANPDLKLKTIGFIWKMVEYSVKFDFESSEGEWFNYYLKDRTVYYESLSINEFHANMEKLVYRNPKFRIPVIFADDLSGSDKSNAKLLRNVARCLAIPCMFSTKNTVILNTMDTEKTINWMILVIRSSKVDVKSICKNLKVVDDLTLDNYLTSDLQLFLQTESGSEFKLLRDLGITSNEDERAKLVGLWKLLLDQSETGLQGVVSLAFSQFVDSLKSIRVGQLDVKNIWISVCDHVSKYILELRMFTFSNDSQYYGLRMFSSHRFIRGSFWDIENKLIKGSIEDHFYYFGSPTDPAILKLDHSNGELVQNNERYKVACNFSPFDQNIILNMVVWKHALLNKSAASFFPNYVNKVCGDFPIYDLKPILHQSKQTITLWAIANCTHQNFVGDSGGKDVVSELIGHLQSSKSIERKFCPFPLDEFTESLGLFLGRIKFPYLLPETFPGLQEKLGDFCRVGKIIQLPEEGRIDVEFELLFDGSSAVGLAMCKYTIEPKTQQDINQSTEIAENRKSPLSFYLCHHLDLQLKCPGALNLEISQTSDVPPFRLNIYSVYHVDEDLKMVPLREYENPDGVFLLIESNMKYGKNL